MKQADYIIDVGPDGGTAGGRIVFTGTPREMADSGQTITAEYLRKALKRESDGLGNRAALRYTFAVRLSRTGKRPGGGPLRPGLQSRTG